MTEIRTVSASGGAKGVKPARFDLIPIGPLWQLAELYGKGAEKYTEYGVCTCAATDQSTPAGFVGTVTTRICDSVTPPSQNGSARTPASGIEPIPSASSEMPPAERSRLRSAPGIGQPFTDSPSVSTTQSSLDLADSATAPIAGDTSTTITPLAESAERSATTATSRSDGSTDSAAGAPRPVSAATSGTSAHSHGCPATQVVLSGDRNWERGYEWSKSFGALQRHAWLFWSGQDIDEHEPDCPDDCRNHMLTAHLASVAWHALALLEWATTHPEFDDRPSSMKGPAA